MDIARPRRPGHPPLVSLRSLAPPYAGAKGADSPAARAYPACIAALARAPFAEAKGAKMSLPLSWGRKGRERSERGMRGMGGAKGVGENPVKCCGKWCGDVLRGFVYTGKMFA